MSSGINEGVGTLLVAQAEGTYLGTPTGVAYELPGRTAFSFAPRLERTSPRASLWRGQDGEQYAARWFEATLEAEWTQGEALALLLSSLMTRTGTTPNYTFTRPGAARKTLALSVNYGAGAPSYVLRGAIAQSLQLNIRARGLVTFRMEFLAGKLDTVSGAIAATSTPAGAAFAGFNSSATYRGVTMGRAYELTLQLLARTAFVQFDEFAVPSRFIPAAPPQASAEVSEWLGDTVTEADRIPADVRGMAEASQRFDVAPAPGKLLRLDLPRALVRSGTPPAFQQGGIAYRAATEAQAGEVLADWPSITMNI